MLEKFVSNQQVSIAWFSPLHNTTNGFSFVIFFFNVQLPRLCKEAAAEEEEELEAAVPSGVTKKRRKIPSFFFVWLSM